MTNVILKCDKNQNQKIRLRQIVRIKVGYTTNWQDFILKIFNLQVFIF